MADEVINELQKLATDFKAAVDRNDEAATMRLNDAISIIEGKMKALEAASNRPSANDTTDAGEAEYKAAFDLYLRKGDRSPEMKSMSAGTASEGGYTVPKVIDSQIRKLLVDVSPLRSLATVLSVNTTDFHMPFSTGGTNSSWVGEKDTRAATNTDTITEIVPPFGELYAKPLVTQTLLEDSQFDIAGFIAGQVATEFARAEGNAFILGDGVKKPSGLLAPTLAATADATRAFGTVQYIASGAAAALTNPDVLITTVHSLKAGYRTGAGWLMNKATLAVVRTFKDANGQYLWQPSLQAGVPSTLLGYPVYEAEDMPSIAANALPIVFGNFPRSYVIADRVGMSMLVDPYTQQPYVAYGSRKRVGGCVVDTQAYKVLKIAAS
jgi:HK97 family phage major capsid protein